MLTFKTEILKMYRLGNEYGYYALLSKGDNRVCQIGFNEGNNYQGGALHTIKNINEELDFSFLKLADQDLYNEIIKIKNGEFCNRYLHLDVNNHNFGIEFKV